VAEVRPAERHGLPALLLTADDGARAEVHLDGAHVASWVPAGGDEQLFMSERAVYRAGSSLRGGIPVIFPQFGPGPLPKHGFARTSRWEPGADAAAGSGAARATLVLRDSDATRAVWPFPFELALTVEVGGRSLAVSLHVLNAGADAFAFTAALHSYLRVTEIDDVALHGLAGVRYRDQAADGRETVDDAPSLVVLGEVDRLYVSPPAELRLRDGREPGARTVTITTTGFPDVVVWNPGPVKARELGDLGEGDHHRMLCVEAAAAAVPVALPAGERWSGTQTLVAGG
jgi:glucose-6-phosphate 1-epimerase